MLLMRPEAAHRVTVFGSTRKSAATSPGVRRRSLLPSTISPPISVSEYVFSVAKTSVYFLVFPKNEPLVFLVSFEFGGTGGAGPRWPPMGCDLAGCARKVAGCGGLAPRRARVVAECAGLDYGMCQALLSAPGGIIGSSPIAERGPPACLRQSANRVAEVVALRAAAIGGRGAEISARWRNRAAEVVEVASGAAGSDPPDPATGTGDAPPWRRPGRGPAGPACPVL